MRFTFLNKAMNSTNRALRTPIPPETQKLSTGLISRHTQVILVKFRYYGEYLNAKAW